MNMHVYIHTWPGRALLKGTDPLRRHSALDMVCKVPEVYQELVHGVQSSTHQQLPEARGRTSQRPLVHTAEIQ